MGQQPYEWPMPDGYPMETSAWSGSMLPRWQFAFALANDEIGGTRFGARDMDLDVRLQLLHGALPAKATLQAVRQAGIGLALAAPEYQWR